MRSTEVTDLDFAPPRLSPREALLARVVKTLWYIDDDSAEHEAQKIIDDCYGVFRDEIGIRAIGTPPTGWAPLDLIEVASGGFKP